MIHINVIVTYSFFITSEDEHSVANDTRGVPTSRAPGTSPDTCGRLHLFVAVNIMMPLPRYSKFMAG